MLRRSDEVAWCGDSRSQREALVNSESLVSMEHASCSQLPYPLLNRVCPEVLPIIPLKRRVLRDYVRWAQAISRRNARLRTEVMISFCAHLSPLLSSWIFGPFCYIPRMGTTTFKTGFLKGARLHFKDPYQGHDIGRGTMTIPALPTGSRTSVEIAIFPIIMTACLQ